MTYLFNVDVILMKAVVWEQNFGIPKLTSSTYVVIAKYTVASHGHGKKIDFTYISNDYTFTMSRLW